MNWKIAYDLYSDTELSYQKKIKKFCKGFEKSGSYYREVFFDLRGLPIEE